MCLVSTCETWRADNRQSEGAVSHPNLRGRCGVRAGALTDSLTVPAEHQPPQDDVQH